jgi:oligopeptide/dipeptide ABC transporter ATP-binding protein
MEQEKVINIENLSIKTRSGRVLVNDISFDMDKGEIMGVVGESGSGKTLTAKTILNLLPEDLLGEAKKSEILGENILTLPAGAKKALVGGKIGYVPQNTGSYLHPMIKIKNQIADGYMYYSGSNYEEALARAYKLISDVGIRDTDRLLNSYPWQLSGGMRHRVNIAMALMIKPRLIIADEPTTALDSTIQKQIMDLFKAVNFNHSTSILIISHDLGLVRYYCQRILVMYAGQIMEEAPVQELFDYPRHPYTRALIKVIPSLGMDKNVPLEEIPGRVPDLRQAATGCIFKERCSYRQAICDLEIKQQPVNQFHTCKCNLNL